MKISKLNKVWDESTIMPWGKWKGYHLEEIPDKYFAWLQKQDWIHNWEALSDYIDGLDLSEEDEYED